jgi:hypothetical protein
VLHWIGRPYKFCGSQLLISRAVFTNICLDMEIIGRIYEYQRTCLNLPCLTHQTNEEYGTEASFSSVSKTFRSDISVGKFHSKRRLPFFALVRLRLHSEESQPNLNTKCHQSIVACTFVNSPSSATRRLEECMMLDAHIGTRERCSLALIFHSYVSCLTNVLGLETHY